MDVSTIKAHVASLLGVPLSQVILKYRPGAVPNFQNKGDYYVIEYGDPKTLVHEFLHSCFTPAVSCKNELYNGIEDYRISIKAQEYDKLLAEANDTVLTPEEIKNITTNIHTGDADKDRLLTTASLMATPSTIDIIKTLQEVDLPEGLKKQILVSRERLKNNPSYWALESEYDALANYINFPKGQEQKPTFRTRYEMREEDADGNPKPTKEIVKENFMMSVESNIPYLEPREKFLLEKTIRKIIQNKSIGKRRYTITGKLVTKRLGSMPSDYMFVKKTAPQPETKLYVLGDASGSMWREKVFTVLTFFNSIRDLDIPNFKLELRMFNAGYWKNEEIPRDFEKFHKTIMETDIATPSMTNQACAYNDDAHFLKVILKEIEQDPTPNKALLILSDGEPAPSGIYKETDLKEVARTTLRESKVPYISIGIDSSSVQKYYKHSKVCTDTTELIDTLYQNTKLLLNK